MRDYSMEGQNGQDIPVAEMSDAEIASCLQRGFVLVGATARENVVERLRIEVLIREHNMRGE